MIILNKKRRKKKNLLFFVKRLTNQKDIKNKNLSIIQSIINDLYNNKKKTITLTIFFCHRVNS